MFSHQLRITNKRFQETKNLLKFTHRKSLILWNLRNILETYNILHEIPTKL